LRGAGWSTSFEALETLDAELCRVALSVGVLRLAMAEGLEALARGGGHHELGFASVEGYALERCERSARWVQGSRALGRRLAELPAIRRALVRGEIGFCMAQVVAGVARADDEVRWVEEARRRTVREMRALVRERTGRKMGAPAPEEAAPETRALAQEGTGQMFAAVEEPRVTLAVTVNREDEWLFEHARLLGKHAGTPGDEMLDALLAEGTTSLLAEMDRSSVEPFDEALDERAPQRMWEQELAWFRDEAEKRCETWVGERPCVVPGDARAGEHSWDGDAEAMDAQLRSVAPSWRVGIWCWASSRRGCGGQTGGGRLGFATESQYRAGAAGDESVRGQGEAGSGSPRERVAAAARCREHARAGVRSGAVGGVGGFARDGGVVGGARSRAHSEASS